MRINKISTPSYNPQFKAVNMKYFKEGMDRCIHSTNINGTLYRLKIDVAFRSISAQDALDTLEALLPYAKKHHLWLFEDYKESFEYFKKLYSEKDWSSFLEVKAPKTVPVDTPITDPTGP